MTSPIDTNNVAERLAIALIADESSHLQLKYLNEALKVCLSECELELIPAAERQSLSDRIDVLERERSAAIELCDTSVTQCPFSKGRAPAVSRPCPKCEATSSEPCRKQVQAAFEAVRMLKAASLSPKEGRLMVELTEMDGHVLFSVRDKISKAIADPGLYFERLRTKDNLVETLDHWQARAAIEAMLQAASSSPSFAAAIRARTQNTPDSQRGGA